MALSAHGFNSYLVSFVDRAQASERMLGGRCFGYFPSESQPRAAASPDLTGASIFVKDLHRSFGLMHPARQSLLG